MFEILLGVLVGLAIYRLFLSNDSENEKTINELAEKSLQVVLSTLRVSKNYETSLVELKELLNNRKYKEAKELLNSVTKVINLGQTEQAYRDGEACLKKVLGSDEEGEENEE